MGRSGPINLYPTGDMNKGQPRSKLFGYLRSAQHGVPAMRTQVNRANNTVNTEHACWRFVQLSVGPNRASALVQHFRRHRAQQQTVKLPMAMRRQYDQVHVFVATGPRDFKGRVSFEQQGSDCNPIEFGLQ